MVNVCTRVTFVLKGKNSKIHANWQICNLIFLISG